MYKYLLSLFLLTSLTSEAQNRDSANVGLLFKESLTNGKAYAWLDYLLRWSHLPIYISFFMGISR